MDITGNCIDNIKDFLDWIEQSRKTYVQTNGAQSVIFEHSHSYYRGQSCKDWPVVASVFRKEIWSITTEYDMLRMSMLRLWKEFKQYPSFLDKLVFLQHYGMKTRLLDVTCNPLIALFFACIPSTTGEVCDGIVYCGHQHLYDNEKVAELTAEYVFTHSLRNIEEEIKTFSRERGVQLWEFAKPIFLSPPFNNERIENQKGAFIMLPLVRLKENSVTAFEGNIEGEHLFTENVAIIPHSSKVKLLKDLCTLGIDRGTIFADISEKVKSIIQEKQWEIEKYNTIKFE